MKMRNCARLTPNEKHTPAPVGMGRSVRNYFILSLILFAALTLYGLLSGKLF